MRRPWVEPQSGSQAFEIAGFGGQLGEKAPISMALRSVLEDQKPRPTSMILSGVGCIILCHLGEIRLLMESLEVASPGRGGQLHGPRRSWMDGPFGPPT